MNMCPPSLEYEIPISLGTEKRNGNEFVFIAFLLHWPLRLPRVVHFVRRRGKSRTLLALRRSKVQKSPVLVRKKEPFRLLRSHFLHTGISGRSKARTSKWVHARALLITDHPRSSARSLAKAPHSIRIGWCVTPRKSCWMKNS